MLLSFVLLFDALEISAPAPVVRAMEESFGAFCTVTDFAELPQELRAQRKPIRSLKRSEQCGIYTRCGVNPSHAIPIFL